MIADQLSMPWRLPIGANPDGGGTSFRVWAAGARQVDVVLIGSDASPTSHALAAQGDGYFAAYVPGVGPGARYMYRCDGGDPRPDPASRFQPASVHGPSSVVDPDAFAWADAAWRGVPRDDLVISEIHVGAAAPAGTFDALIARLDDLRSLGVSVLELMPVADFPGQRGWGYDGVCLFAPARAYGGPAGLKRLVDAAHARGLAVLLDVVYNHLGPDGNYLRQFSQAYFTDRHTTPWGEALNFAGPGSRPVRDFFIANACYWAHEYHLDGLRLDATHAILDDSPTHILAEIAATAHASLPPDRHFLLIAENERNDPTLVRSQEPEARGQEAQPPGYGLDAVWADDFHHQIRVALAGDRDGYYADYQGTAADLAATLRQGWFYIGQRSAHLGHPRGAPADDVPYPAFVYCIQNHDQIGNRALGDRLHHQIGLDAYRVASVLLLLGPATPLLFMGQEWAASSPFQYFTDHQPELGRLVTEGRRAEFASFAAFAGETVPDPQEYATFARSKLRWEERAAPPHAQIEQLYRDLLDLRRRHPALRERSRGSVAVAALGERTLALRRSTIDTSGAALLALIHLGGTAVRVDLSARAETAAPAGARWALLLDSEAPQYGGSGAPFVDTGSLTLDGPRAIVWQATPAHDHTL
jgi:maltooligosyltrehalose trehalohydrolase